MEFNPSHAPSPPRARTFCFCKGSRYVQRTAQVPRLGLAGRQMQTTLDPVFLALVPLPLPLPPDTSLASHRIASSTPSPPTANCNLSAVCSRALWTRPDSTRLDSAGSWAEHRASPAAAAACHPSIAGVCDQL